MIPNIVEKMKEYQNLEKMNNDTLRKIINLILFINKETTYVDLIKKTWGNRKYDEIETESIQVQINSILADMGKIKYKKRIKGKYYNIYEYEKTIDIYFNDPHLETNQWNQNIEKDFTEKNISQYNPIKIIIYDNGSQKTIKGPNFIKQILAKKKSDWWKIKIKLIL